MATAAARIEFTDVPIEWKVLPTMLEPKAWKVGGNISLDGWNGLSGYITYVCDGFITVRQGDKHYNVTAVRFIELRIVP